VPLGNDVRFEKFKYIFKIKRILKQMIYTFIKFIDYCSYNKYKIETLFIYDKLKAQNPYVFYESRHG
jgi:hypothetical protein